MKPHIGSKVNCEFIFSRERSEMKKNHCDDHLSLKFNCNLTVTSEDVCCSMRNVKFFQIKVCIVCEQPAV